MWLLNIKTRALELFHGDDVPEYAILSHRWTDNEVSFQDIQPRRYRFSGKWPPKLEGTRKKAKEHGYKYIWVDTCCIDKSSSAELEEAINSMFQWYKNAAVCYAYLPDVTRGDTPLLDIKLSNFHSSSWFTRGWTLQELIAPNKPFFYDSTWKYIGNKGEMSHIIESITSIPRAIVVGVRDPRQASIAQRMSWAANRVTTRKEDMAYCLLGVFGVTMPMIYGEGDKAFARLQEEIMKDSADFSILAGASISPVKEPSLSYDLFLATLPSEFAHCGGVIPCNALDHGKEYEPRPSVTDLRLKCPEFDDPKTGEKFAVLSCYFEDNPDALVGIPILTSTAEPQRTRGPTTESRSFKFRRIPRAKVQSIKSAINVVGRRSGKATYGSHSTQDWWYLQSTLESHKLKMIEFEPSTPQVAKAIRMLRSGSPQEIGPLERLLLRYRDTTQKGDDFVVALLFPRPSDPRFLCGTYMFPHHSSLRISALKSIDLTSSDEKPRSGSLSLRVSVSQESFDRGNFFVVKLSASPVSRSPSPAPRSSLPTPQPSAATSKKSNNNIKPVVPRRAEKAKPHTTPEVAKSASYFVFGLPLPLLGFYLMGWTAACVLLLPVLLAKYWKRTPMFFLQNLICGVYLYYQLGAVARVTQVYRYGYCWLQYDTKNLVIEFAAWLWWIITLIVMYRSWL